MLTPDVRRMFADLERRLGVLERRVSPPAIGGGASHNGSGTNSIVVLPDGDTTGRASGNTSVAVGYSAKATNTDAVAVGDGATASGASESLAAGALSTASGQYSSAVGPASQASAQFATALGDSAEATATQATGLGANTIAGHTAATAVGYAAATTAAHQIMLGTATETVVIPGDVNISGTVSGFSGGGDRIPGANAFTTSTVTGFGVVASFDGTTNNGAAVGLMLDGDTKPRVLLRSDGQVLLGDGTADPTDAGMYLNSGRIVVYSASGVLLDGGAVEVASGDILCSGGGPVLYAPDTSAHRIVVSNAGALSTVTA